MGLVISTLLVFQGCASEQTETVRRTTMTSDTAPPSTTTTTETTTSKKPDSVLGATAHAVGTVILFPFRLVGDALGLIV
jgi:hypothetical protein